ncbi:DUF2232 domain-containing protein [Candidatus Latescibacterota bacterium]
MEYNERLKRFTFAVAAGISAGAFFSWMVGDIDAAHYVVELLSIGPLEIPFIVLAAIVTFKFSWKNSLAYIVLGTAGSFLLVYPSIIMTPLIFLKTALMGVLIGEVRLLRFRFSWRLVAVTIPGVILALTLGMPLVYDGVGPETLKEIRTEALEMYEAFMERNDAINAVDNAMTLFDGFFRLSIGIFSVVSFVLSWLSFHVTRWVLSRMRVESREIPPLVLFSMPLHAIWIFLAGLAVYLLEIKLLYPITLNILFIMAALYSIQGLAIVTYLMRRAGLGLLPRIFFWLIFFVTIHFSVFILVLTGLIDNWINLRPVSHPADEQMTEDEDKENESNT